MRGESVSILRHGTGGSEAAGWGRGVRREDALQTGPRRGTRANTYEREPFSAEMQDRMPALENTAPSHGREMEREPASAAASHC